MRRPMLTFSLNKNFFRNPMTKPIERPKPLVDEDSPQNEDYIMDLGSSEDFRDFMNRKGLKIYKERSED